MTDDEMREILTRTREAQCECLRFQGEKDTVSNPLAEPASEDELNKLSTHLARRGIQIPPSYRQFLKITNGSSRYRWLARFSLRSAAEIVRCASGLPKLRECGCSVSAQRVA